MKVVAVEERTQGITLLRGLVGRPGMNETRSGDCDEGGARFMAERMKPDTSRLLLKHAVDPGTPAARSAGVPGSCRFAPKSSVDVSWGVGAPRLRPDGTRGRRPSRSCLSLWVAMQST